MIHACTLDDLPAVRWGRHGAPIPYGPRAGRSHREALDLAVEQGRRISARRLLTDLTARGDASRRRVAPRSSRPRFSPALTDLYEGMLHARLQLVQRLFIEYAGPAIQQAQRELNGRRALLGGRSDADPWADIQRVILILRSALARTSGDEEGLRYLGTELAEDTTDSTDTELSRLFNIPIATAAGGQDKVDAWIRANVDLISSLQGSALDDVEQLVRDAASGGRPTLDLAEEIQGRFGVSWSRASLIARDQTAKLSAQISRAQHERYGVTRYQWSTSGDSRVRQEHAELDGRIFEYARPPIADRRGTRGNPGEVWQCRCTDLAVLPDDDVEQLLAGARARQERELLILQASPTVRGEIPNRSGFSDWNRARIEELRRGARSAVGL